VWSLPDALRVFSPGASLATILAAVRQTLSKLNALDAVERYVQRVRACEVVKGQADEIWRQALTAIDAAQDVGSVRQARDGAIRHLEQVPQVADPAPLRVGMIGEIYVVLEPFVNMEIERELGRLGVHVHRTIMLSDWTRFTLFLSALGMGPHDRAHRAAMPYLGRDVGGDGWESVGETILHARNGFDGMIHLAPFTCMPETIAQNIMVRMRPEVDIPVLEVTCDEQMGRAGMLTRIEAFVDLLWRKRAARGES
jgi:predicted nucleotide-binding protein (sugar kinase/HSP70/actin superfamily)